jgi:hypothetical protein
MVPCNCAVGEEKLRRETLLSSGKDYSQKLFEHVHGRSEGLSEQTLERIKWVADHIPVNVSTILDLGAGRCHLSNLLIDRHFQVTSLDLVLSSLKKSSGLRVQASSTELPFKSNSFDLVLCAEVIEHMRSRERLATLQEIWRVARHYVLLTVPNNEDLNEMLICCDRCGHVFHAWGHLQSFNAASMQIILPLPPTYLTALARPTKRYFFPLLALRQKVFKTYGYDAYVVCPNCSNTDVSEPRRTFPVKVLDRLNYWLSLESEAGWLLALYEKREHAPDDLPVKPSVRKVSKHNRIGIVTWLDRFFMSLQLRCDLLGTRLSWRIGQSIRTVVTALHEAFLDLRLRRGRTLVSPELVGLAQAALPRVMPRYPSLYPYQQTVTQRAKELLQGFYVLDDGTTIKIETFSWSHASLNEKPSISRFLFHCLDSVRELVEAYNLTGDRAYLDRAKAVASRWIYECLYLERPEQIWDDHITALRAIVLCQLWVACLSANPYSPEFMQQLLSAILRHAERLAQKGFYRRGHNHGVTQAYALLALSLLLPSIPEASSWVELGRVRLEQQMAENVSQEGMHREHSPYYHLFVFNQFLYAYEFGLAHGIEFSQAFTDRLRKMLLCGAYLLKPNGTLIALGDTCKSSPLLVNAEDVPEWFSKARERYLYSVSGGSAGTQPEENSIHLPDGGVALLRSGWGTERKFEDECFLAVRTRTFDTSHIHRDQLSFELYAYGDDLIVDSGGPYGYGEPMREFFLSTAAHNTVVVDGKEQGIGKAKVLKWRTSSIFDLLVAEQRSYPGVVHRRVVLFVRPDYFLILDRLEAEDRHAYAQFLHLNPGLNARCDNLAVTTTSPSHGPTVQIIPLLEPGLAVKVHQGADQPMQGWVCVGERQKVVNTVVEYQRLGCTEEFAVLLVPQPPGISTAVRARLEEFTVSRDRRILIVLGKRQDEIVISKDGRVTVSRAWDVN